MIKEVAVIICVVVVLLLVLCAVLLSRVTQTGGAPMGRHPKTIVGGSKLNIYDMIASDLCKLLPKAQLYDYVKEST